ncbi:TetR/AcrR family transcriptional regulator [Photobacterium kasasachensis]|uniref:TetR/AcrR family transcriptional regulator n=1 Tax=Photobacterium kasasachensis TaxID=2910240 RepID=UPI003D0F43E0
MTEKRVGRQTAKAAEETRKQILCAATELFCSQGFKAVSLRAISEKAGVSHSLIRHHFGSKLKIWKQVNDEMENYFRQYISDLLHTQDPQLKSNYRLFNVLTTLLARLLVDPRPMQILADAMKQEQELVVYFLDESYEMAELFECLLNECHKEGYIQDYQVNELKWLTASYAHSATSLAPLMRGTYPEVESESACLLKHWHLYARMLAAQLEIPADDIPQPAQLEDLLQAVPWECK